MDTFYIANNKTKQASIIQTEKTRDEIWFELDDSVDVVYKCLNAQDAQGIIDEKAMEYVPYDSFIK